MHSNSQGNESGLRLRLFAEGESLRLEVTNTGSEPVRLWNQDNSWGWEMPRVLLSLESNDKPVELRPGARLWTRNFPAYTQLNAREAKSYRLQPEDYDPQKLMVARQYISQPLLLSAQLHADRSPEQAEHGVWQGCLESEQQIVEPPHRWLGILSEVKA